MERTDEDIVELCQNGDTDLFKTLIDRYTAPLYNVALRFTDARNAPDAVQEIFLKAWKHLQKFDSTKARFKTWLFAIARNTLTDMARKKKSLVFSAMDGEGEDAEHFADTIPDTAILPDEALDKAEHAETLRRALAELSPADQEVLTLHYEHDLTFEEIGAVLRASPNTVKSRHRRAILALRKALS